MADKIIKACGAGKTIDEFVSDIDSAAIIAGIATALEEGGAIDVVVDALITAAVDAVIDTKIDAVITAAIAGGGVINTAVDELIAAQHTADEEEFAAKGT